MKTFHERAILELGSPGPGTHEQEEGDYTYKNILYVFGYAFTTQLEPTLGKRPIPPSLGQKFPLENDMEE